ncbi:MAG: hypothetical protein ACRC7G_09195 [Beijerinckiaceae bacterium]
MELNRRTLVVSFAALVMPASAQAHEPRKGPNGGELVDAGSYHVEVVGKGSTLEVYVSDSVDKPLAAGDFKALAIMVIDGKSQRIALEPVAGGSRFTGTSPVPITRVRGAIQLTDKAGKTATGRIN